MFDLAYARKQDAADTLAHFRSEFYIPTDGEGQELIYLCGNSLGLQPKAVEQFMLQELEDWRKLGVEGHTQARQAWLSYHEQFAEPLARLVGAQPSEVVVMNSLTTNLHLLMISFYRPTAQKYKIIIEKGAFPSDKYAVDSQLRLHGYPSQTGLVELSPRAGEETLRHEDILATIEAHKDSTALILLGGVNYYTGQVFDMQAICALAQNLGIVIGLDLAHAVGNVPLQLHDWGADFAVWCHYKYLNSGAGATAGAFVHSRHLGKTDIPRLEGWWGHDKATRFKMPDQFAPIHTAEAWQLSNAPVFSMCPLRASLAVFEQTNMAALRAKSIKLSRYLLDCLRSQLADKLHIISPEAEESRGCQVSIAIVGTGGKAVHQALTLAGVVSDWREPSVIRVAPTPLYNSYEDVYHFVHRLASLSSKFGSR
jgi:kynureninase